MSHVSTAQPVRRSRASSVASRHARPTTVAYAELQAAWDEFNAELFDDQLPDCLITFTRNPRTYGYFSAGAFTNLQGQVIDEIALNPRFFPHFPFIDVLSTLVHEQVHQWHHHFGPKSRKGYHCKAWAAKMTDLGLIPSSTGRPGGRRTGQNMSHYPQPGGRFMKACERIVALRGVGITWYDRYPVKPRTPSSGSDEDREPDEDLAADSHTDDPLALAMSVALLPTSATLPPASAGYEPAPLDPDAVGTRSTRAKFTCPRCGSNAWGKPGLRLACLDCESTPLLLVSTQPGPAKDN